MEPTVKATDSPCAQDHLSLESGMIFTLKRVRGTLDDAVQNKLHTVSKRRLLKEADCVSDEENEISRVLRLRPWTHYDCEPSSEDESDGDEMDKDSKSAGLPIGIVRGCPSCAGCQKVYARWQPENGCRPVLEDAPVFFPLEEEFGDTMKYIASISAEAEKYGICRIVPPHSWRPPCPLKDNEKRRTAKFPTRVQQIDKLQVREAEIKKENVNGPQGLLSQKDGCTGRTSSSVGDACKDAFFDEDCKFGFEPGPEFTIESFEKYARQFEEEYFGVKDTNSFYGKPKERPSIESIEGEYWRIVERATEQIEILYGADIETREFGSGFPRAKPACEPTPYERSGWNLNNIARFTGSVLSFEEAEISGVLVPWLYLGMCFSSFCWHVEDHHFYSLNYMHFGSPKVWYGVPGSAASRLEDAMKKHMPDLFEEQPDLLHKLVTQLSPSVLKAAGVPVYRAVQRAGEFVVTFPRAYHAGFNSGFNCAEAVNVAPLDWLPHGQKAIEMYKEQRRKSSVSHDKLLFGAARHALGLLYRCSGIGSTVDVCTWQESFGKREVLVKALKGRVDLERRRRALIERNVRVKKMDKTFDAVVERECFVCHYDLHLSAVGCECVADNYACLEHIDELCVCEVTRKYAMYRYDLSELDILLVALEGNPQAFYNLQKTFSLMPSSYPKVEVLKQSSNTLHNLSLPTSLQNLTVIPGDSSRPDELGLPSISGHLKDNIQNGHTFQSTNHVSGAQGVEVIELSDDEVDAAGCPESSYFQKNSFGVGHSHEKIERTSVVMALPSQIISSSTAFNEDQLVRAVSQPGTSCPSPNVSMNLYYSSSETAVWLPPQCPAGFGNGANNSITRRDFSSVEHFPSSIDGWSGSSLACAQLNTYQSIPKVPISNAVGNEYQAQNIANLTNHAFPSVGGRGPGNNKEHSYNTYALPIQPQGGYKVDLLNVGRLVLHKTWSSKDAIFPAGFRSRVLFPSILDPCQLSFYVSEVLDCGHADPLFKVVMENYPSEVFIHPSIDRCWQMVQERVNMTLHLQHHLGNLRFSFQRSPEDIRGAELFGFTSPHIIKAVESLDWQHQCLEYWTGRISAVELLENQHHAQMTSVKRMDYIDNSSNFKEPFLMVPCASQKILETASVSFNSVKARHKFV